jgi:hypothetical protein
MDSAYFLGLKPPFGKIFPTCSDELMLILPTSQDDSVTRKVVRKVKLGDLAYWLNRPPEEQVEAVDLLRRDRYGSSSRLQRHVRVVKQASC